MLNSPCFLSIIIINNLPNKLLPIIDFLHDQIIGKKDIQLELIIINNLKYINTENFNISVLKSLKKYPEKIEIKIINLQENEFISSRLEKIIMGDIAIFTTSNYLPDDNWLENIIQTFSDDTVSVLVGDILDRESELDNNDISADSTIKYLQLWQRQMSNLAIKTEFLRKINYFDFLEQNKCLDKIHCRLLRELEDEIVYIPQIIVRNHDDI